MKKLWALVFSVAFAFAVVGCDSGSTDTKKPDAKPGASDVKKDAPKPAGEMKKDAPAAPAPGAPAAPAPAAPAPAPAPAK